MVCLVILLNLKLTKAMTVSQEMADLLKEEGNNLYKEGKWQAACDKYTAAIELDGENPFYYSNRAAANIEMKL